MMRSSQFARAIMMLAYLACILAVSPPVAADHKSFTIDQARIEATVTPSGDMDVSASRHFTFNGDFSAIYWGLGTPPDGATQTVSNVCLGEIGQCSPLSAVPFQPEWRSKGGPGKKAYSFDEANQTVWLFAPQMPHTVEATVRYTIQPQVTRYDDVAQVYWKFVPEKNEVDTSDIDLTLTLPAPAGHTSTAGEVRAWGHGPLDGQVSIDYGANTVHASVSKLPPGQFAEIRATFPAEWVDAMPPHSPGIRTGHALSGILQQEKAFVEKTQLQQRMKYWARIAFYAIPALAAGIVYVFRRRTREPGAAFQEQYWTQRPDAAVVPDSAPLHPVVVGLNDGKSLAKEGPFNANLTRLVLSGDIALQDGPETEPVLVNTRATPQRIADPIDDAFMTFVFNCVGQGAGSVPLSAFTERAKADPRGFRDGYRLWETRAQTTYQSAGLRRDLGKKKAIAIIALMLLGLCLIPTVTALVITKDATTGLESVPILFVFFCVLIVFVAVRRQRTPLGAQVHAQSRALERWLQESADQNEGTPSDRAGWRDQMVYAQLYGMGETVVRTLVNRAPTGIGSTPGSGIRFPTISYWSDTTQAVSAAFSSAQAEVSAALDSSGGGGGFSGGGGGGSGGGGGIGAR